MENIKGKTSRGFNFEIEPERLDSIELMQALRNTDESEVYIVDVALHLLGDDQRKRLYDYHRRDDGTVPAGVIIEEIGEMFEAADKQDGETKNS